MKPATTGDVLLLNILSEAAERCRYCLLYQTNGAHNQRTLPFLVPPEMCAQEIRTDRHIIIQKYEHLSACGISSAIARGGDDVVDSPREDFTERAGRYDLLMDIVGDRSLARLRRPLTSRGTLVIV